MKSSAVILAGGYSIRIGQDKALINLAGKPLILHVIDEISQIIDEILVVVRTNLQKKKLQSLLSPQANIFVDKYEDQSPLVGALTGFEIVNSEYSLLLPCDTPFISSEIAQFLLETCGKKGAAIPRWPNGHIEPLHAVYNALLAFEAGKNTLEQGKLDLHSMINQLHDVRYIPIPVLEQFDPRLLTFFNINTSEDLKNAEALFLDQSNR